MFIWLFEIEKGLEHTTRREREDIQEAIDKVKLILTQS